MWEQLRKEEVIYRLKTDKNRGLNKDEVKRRREKYGINIIEEKKKESIIIKFFKQFNDFMIIILIIASIISFFVSYMQKENDYIDSVIIIVIVVLNAIMGLVQESKAEKSIEALKKMTSKNTKVIREGKTREVDSQDLVPGDIIILEAGKLIPADARLIKTANFKVEESSLTGETEEVLKDENMICRNNTQIGDMRNMVFSSSVIVKGTAIAVVTETGMNTKVGHIANLMMKNEAPQTPIQKKLGQVGKILGIVCLIICVIIFLIGIMKKIDIVEMFMTSVGLAVAAIPEGLPAIVTIVLSIGVTKMAKKNSIIRKLPAVETLGSSNVICSDKTGTLTQNKMKVVEVNAKNRNIAIEYGAICTNCEILDEKNTIKVIGEPTEKAIVEYALDNGKNKLDTYKNMKRVREIPFDSNRKMMSIVLRINNKYRVITKGAPDILIDKCVNELNNIGEKDALNKTEIQKENLKMAKRALRVIAVAYKDIDYLPKELNEKELENNLTFIGLIGMIDPPREGVKEAIKECKRAGIKTVMITGDHIETAVAIAKQLNILEVNDKQITGRDIDKMSQKELENNIKNYSVFARVTPEHKVRIVEAWQKNGMVVAMTGDGVNDSPALKKADIGIAMGKNGTDVAKNAADMILTDDNFVTIVEAVKQGRNIYDNIKKAIHFLIATNIGEIITIFVGLILGFKSPLLAIQLLWINLVTDSFPAIALGLEREEENIMNRKPINSKKGIFSDGLWNKIIVEGCMIGMLTLLAFSIGNKFFDLEVGRTMAFIVMGISELIHSFNIKSEESILNKKILNNKFLILSFIIGIFVQIIIVIVPTFSNIFKLCNLTKIQWIITIVIGILPIPIMEIQKKLNEMKFGKRLYIKENQAVQ